MANMIIPYGYTFYTSFILLYFFKAPFILLHRELSLPLSFLLVSLKEAIQSSHQPQICLHSFICICSIPFSIPSFASGWQMFVHIFHTIFSFIHIVIFLFKFLFTFLKIYLFVGLFTHTER